MSDEQEKQKEYLFYYHEDNWEKVKDDGSFIWYYKTVANSLKEALDSFTTYCTGEERIIQVIVKSNLN